MNTQELPSISYNPPLVLNGQPLSLEHVDSVARGQRKVVVADDESIQQLTRNAQDLINRAVQQERPVYGITTGFGGMAGVVIPPELAASSQSNLLHFLNAGAGPPIEAQHVRAAMLLRANMFLQGISGVRIEIAERLATFLNANATPMVRRLGSIGASGDLVPLSAIARAITGQGECQVFLNGSTLSGEQALSELELKPIELLPKEGLAIVNGTSFSTAIAANCVSQVRSQLALSVAINAMMFRGLSASEGPLAEFVHLSKPHPGQVWAAATLRELLAADRVEQAEPSANEPQPQDRYSLRCLPQYLGPIVEGLADVTRVIETEMNSVTDNPLIDPERQEFHQSGNFLGMYVGVAMDNLRRYIGLLAKHLDVQIAQLVMPGFNRGLPASLVGNPQRVLNMGLKGLQLTGNSIMPVLVYLGNPLVEHSPTHAEQYNQNVNGLSWGAADLATQSVELFNNYLSVALLFAIQSADLRAKQKYGHYDGRAILGDVVTQLYEAVYAEIGVAVGGSKPLVFDDDDQNLEEYLSSLVDCIREQGSIVLAVSTIKDSLSELSHGC